MKANLTPILFLVLVMNSACFFAQNQKEQIENGGQYPMKLNSANEPCVNSELNENIQKQCSNFYAKYLQNNPLQKPAAPVLFNWPLKTAPGFNDCSYYFIAAHVDLDPAANIYKDYTCGTQSYDGHNGTDIALFPYPLYKMDNNQVQVIAAAAGTIVTKIDGNFDKNCGANALNPNYIIVQHTGGSCAIYMHFKKNSLTAKIVGQTVAVGEFLGNVGSSGSSSGPHLHFEVWAGNNVGTLNDPFTGPCNSLNPTTWWVSQKPYTEPAVVKISTHTVLPVMPGCPVTETPNEDSVFTPGGTGIFTIFMRYETSGTVNLRIVSPGGSTFSAWTYSCSNISGGSWHHWTKPLPPSGTYTFETTYNGIICSKTFTVTSPPLDVSELNYVLSNVQVYPNPNFGSFNLQIDNEIVNAEIILINSIGQKVYGQKIMQGTNEINIKGLANGLYYYSVLQNKQTLKTGKISVE